MRSSRFFLYNNINIFVWHVNKMIIPSTNIVYIYNLKDINNEGMLEKSKHSLF